MTGMSRQVGRTIGAGIGVGAASLLAAGGIGWLASRNNPLVYLFSVAPIALMIALYFTRRPVLLLWGAVLGGLVITGLTKLYLPQLQLVRWTLMPIALTLAVYGLWDLSRPRIGLQANRTPAVIWWALAFVAAALLASLSSPFVPDRFTIGLKGYFQVWGLLIALTYITWPAGVIDRLPRLFVVIALIQLPFVLHQLIFLVPARVNMGDGVVPIDIVSGTFGASLEGGGANAILNAFLTIVIAGLVAARQYGVISTKRLLVLSIPLAIPLFVNEAKVTVLYMLAVFAVLFGRDIIERPLRFVAASLAAALLLAAMMFAYTIGTPSSARVESFADLIKYTYEYNVVNDDVGDQLSRFGAMRFWLERQGLNDVKGTLIGNGIGFTRVGDTETPFRETAKSTIEGIPVDIDLKQKIGNTAVPALLWETGVLGLFCILGLLAATFRSAGRLEKFYIRQPERAAALRGVRVALVIIFITLWHKSVLVFDVGYQTLLMLLIGYVAYWERQSRLAMQPLRVASGNVIPAPSSAV
jgi:hypothetical protein